MIPNILGPTTINGSTARGASSPGKPAHCITVLLVRTCHDAEHLGPDNNVKEQSARKLAKPECHNRRRAHDVSCRSGPYCRAAESCRQTREYSVRSTKTAKPAMDIPLPFVDDEQARGVFFFLFFFLFLGGRCPAHLIQARDSAGVSGTSWDSSAELQHACLVLRRPPPAVSSPLPSPPRPSSPQAQQRRERRP